MNGQLMTTFGAELWISAENHPNSGRRGLNWMMAKKDRPEPPPKDGEQKPSAGMSFDLEDIIAAGITAILVKRPRKKRIPTRGAQR